MPFARHTARRRLRRAGLWRSREPGGRWSWMRWEQRVADAVSPCVWIAGRGSPNEAKCLLVPHRKCRHTSMHTPARWVGGGREHHTTEPPVRKPVQAKVAAVNLRGRGWGSGAGSRREKGNKGVRRSVRCTTMRFHGGVAWRPHARVGPTPPRPRAAGGVCVGSRQSGSATSVGCVCLWGCAAQGAPCKRAGSWAVRRKARSGSTQPLQRSTPRALCCHAAVTWIRSLPRTARLGQTLGCPPHSTTQSAACIFRGGREGMLTGAGCEGSMTGCADAVIAALNLRGTVVGLGRGCGQQRTVAKEGSWCY